MAELPVNPLSEQAAENYLRKMKEPRSSRRRTNRQICICGHSLNFHTEVGDRTVCSPGRMTCRCVNVRAVLEVDDIRLFLRNTAGVGAEHALGQGLSACVARGVTFSWIESPPLCDMCTQPMFEGVYPVAVNPHTGTLTDISTGIDKLVCASCFVIL
jgi:hypothetical protein